MARVRVIVYALILAVSGFAITSSSIASSSDFKIIVNRSNPVTFVSRHFLRDVFLKRTMKWDRGEVVRPIDLPKSVPAHDRFTEEVLNKTPESLSAHWLQRIFSGTDIPPPEAPSPAAALAYVIANPGAVSYLPVDVDPGASKVIELR